MKNIYLSSKHSRLGKLLALLLTVMTSFAFCGSAYAVDDLSYWNLHYYNGTDQWLPNGDGYGFPSTVDVAGFNESFIVKGFWLKFTFEGGYIDGINVVFTLNDTYIADYWCPYVCDKCGYVNYETHKDDFNYDLLSYGSIRNPGLNTLKITFEAKANNSVWITKEAYVNFTIPGFSVPSGTMTFGTLPTGGSKEYTFNYYHYGETLEGQAGTACAITGADAADFTVTGISNNGVSVKFTPTGEGNKTATLTVTDFRKNKCVITLTGSAYQKPVVRIADDALVDGNSVNLKGYLELTGCVDINTYGFVYKQGDVDNPEVGGTELPAEGSGSIVLNRGKVFEKAGEYTFDPQAGTWYSYRSYVKVNGDTYYSDEVGKFFVDRECDYPTAEPIVFHIDASYATNNKCKLTYKSLEQAINDLKTIGVYYDGGTTRLLKNIIFEVAEGTYVSTSQIGEVTGGDVTDATVFFFEHINEVENPDKYLTVTAANPLKKPTIQHVVIRNSRNIIFDNVTVKGDDVKRDNAFDIDNGVGAWNTNDVGAFENANILIKNCDIESNGFTCLHVSAIDGITFENNEIVAHVDATDKNTSNWGASAKFINAKNVKFVRNSFTGAHVTSVFMQCCANVLLMNNVFWHDNNIASSAADYNKPAIIRLVSYYDKGSNHDLQNIGIYYNTFFYADGANKDEKIDFFKIGGVDNFQAEHHDAIIADKLAMQYNNCYSYSSTIEGHTDAPFGTRTPSDFCASICKNNFWSRYDEDHKGTDPAYQSVFNLGCNNAFINVEQQVCQTGALDPAGLVIKGSALNSGVAIANDISGLGAESIDNDRLHEGSIRPSSQGETPVIGGGVFGQLILNVNSNVSSASAKAKVSAVNLTAGAIVNCSITGTGAAYFSVTPASLTVAGDGTLNSDVTVTFNKPASEGTYPATVSISGDGVSMSIAATGNYSQTAPVEGGWTLGAYQQYTAGQGSEEEVLKTIVWFGGADGDEDNWDNRNNWFKLDGTRVTCVDNLSDDLTVIIPEANSTKYPTPQGGITYYPYIPVFGEQIEAHNIEAVRAGIMEDNTQYLTKFFETMEIEEGAPVLGVENLMDDVRHYGSAKNQFTAGRKEWILVGTVIMPFTDGTKSAARNINSGDYFIEGHTPHVYMHQAYINGDKADWHTPFTSLEESVDPDKVFAIRIPDEYGNYKLSAQWYYYGQDKAATEGDAPKTFSHEGWFYNESGLPSYSGMVAGQLALLSNTYPANISLENLVDKKGTFQIWDYDDKGFRQAISTDVIKSQNGFAFNPSASGSLDITKDDLSYSNTKYKSAEVATPSIFIRLANITGEGGNKVLIKYDELKEDEYNLNTDAPHITNAMSEYNAVPEMYAMRYGKNLAGVTVPTLTQSIPLGVNIKQDMTVEFSMYSNSGFSKATLLDAVTGNLYDLLAGEKYQVSLAKGLYDDRFFLNLDVEKEVVTDVEEQEENSGSIINIDAMEDGSVIISSSDDEILKEAEITSMSGNTWKVSLNNPHYNIVKIDGVQGAYIVKAIGETQSKTAKVIVK
ncbi:MAG: hypothetical protein MJ003_01625 [Paludibacteraceae bacterium]|nr:hypothetical protein [Paludibacteraceae bacterium]